MSQARSVIFSNILVVVLAAAAGEQWRRRALERRIDGLLAGHLVVVRSANLDLLAVAQVLDASCCRSVLRFLGGARVWLLWLPSLDEGLALGEAARLGVAFVGVHALRLLPSVGLDAIGAICDQALHWPFLTDSIASIMYSIIDRCGRLRMRWALGQ